MADNLFEIEQRLTLTKSGGSAEAELKKVRDQIKGVSDETKAYNEWLAKNAKELGEVSKAQAAAADESERYQQVLEKMRVAQVMETQEAEKSVKWTQSKKEGSADLSKTLSALQGNLVEATAAGKKENEVTAEAFTSKKQLKDMVQQLGREFPLLGMAGRLAINPIVAATAALTAGITLMIRKNDEAVKSYGGFELADVPEDVVSRYERNAQSSGEIKENVSAIGTVFKQFEKGEDIANAFAKGFGKDEDPARRAQAAREAAERSVAKAAELRAQAGNFDPNNPTAGDMSSHLPELKKKRDELFETLVMINSVRDGSAGAMGSMKYMATFGLTNPETQAEKYQAELSQTDAQMAAINAAGKRRGARGAAFAGAQQAEAQAAELYERAAAGGATGATGQGKAAADAVKDMDGSAIATVAASLRLAAAIKEGARLQAQAAADQENANRVRDQQQ